MKRSSRWTSNTVGLLGALAAVVAVAVAMSWAAPSFLRVTFSASGQDAQIAEGVPVEPAPVRLVMAALADLDTAPADIDAVPAIEQAMCAAPPTSPLFSDAIVTGQGTQAIVMAMPPGAGTWAGTALAASLANCLPGARAVTPPDGFPAWSAASEALGALTTVWARGDVVVVASGSRSDIAALDDVLSELLVAQRCADLTPDAADYLHNPVVAGDGYQHPTREISVTVDRAEPVDGDGVALSTPTAVDAPDPGPPVVVPETPAGRTYWPALPDEVPRPSIDLPDSAPATETTVLVNARDDVGPGCGWEFFAYSAAETADASEEEVAFTVTAAQEALTAAGEAWASQVVLFWGTQQQYLEDLEEYVAYRDAVLEVESNWIHVVAPLWEDYEQALEDFRVELDAFEARQSEYDTAAASWDEALASCTERPVQSESPAIDTDAAGGGVPYCDTLEPPAILDEPAPVRPQMPEAPSPPAPENSTTN